MKKCFILLLLSGFSLASHGKGEPQPLFLALNLFPPLFSGGTAYEISMIRGIKPGNVLSADIGFCYNNADRDAGVVLNPTKGFYLRAGYGITSVELVPGERVPGHFFHWSVGLAYSHWSETHTETFQGTNYGNAAYTYPEKTKNVMALVTCLELPVNVSGSDFFAAPGVELSAVFLNSGRDETFPSTYIPGIGSNLNQSTSSSLSVLTPRLTLRVGYRFR